MKKSRIPREAERFMTRALELARRALGRTSPNPAVGAVIVRDGKIVGEGYHRAAGKPHAEVEAIKSAGSNARDAELYVTLEPCNHHGRTPPCTAAILEAGIKRVWYGTDDPNPDVLGGGAETLRAAGIEVIGGVNEDSCRRLIEVYLTNIGSRRPFVFLKLAMSLDGRIATRTGHSQWISSEESRAKVHRLRDRVSAVMVGIGTVLADDPSLTTRLAGRKGRDPIRVVADSNLRTPLNAKIFNPSSASQVIIGTRKSPPSDFRSKLERNGAKIVETSGKSRVDIADLLSQLYHSGITSVLIEGGGQIAWGALEAQVVDRCLFFYAPMIIGGESAPTGIKGIGIGTLDEAPRLVDAKAIRVGTDLLIDGRVAYPTDRMEAP
ncbi:MAG: bifunctional diaminohydroxyphosphoribosylaminopyrimidine deaminase/5-amino-6-(5-phosphoribosylamino)uracil reductase RibD [Pseudomonadota bacterium]